MEHVLIYSLIILLYCGNFKVTRDELLFTLFCILKITLAFVVIANETQ